VQGTEPAFIEHYIDSRAHKLLAQIRNHKSGAGLTLSYLKGKAIATDCIGSSFAAIRGDASMDTSMGYSPLSGLLKRLKLFKHIQKQPQISQIPLIFLWNL
jgi:hypothetical protein